MDRPAESDRWRAWDAFVEATPETGFMQTSWWAGFRVDHGYEHFAAILKTSEGIVGGALVLKLACSPRHCFYYMQDGPVLPGDDDLAAEVLSAILKSLEERRQTETHHVTHLRIEPRWTRLPAYVSRFQPVPAFADDYSEPRHTLCVDLRPSEDAILAQMKPKGRYNIRLAQRHGVTVVEDASPQGVADFIRIYKRTAARQGMQPKPPDYFRGLLAALTSRGKGSLFFAEYRGKRLAGAIVVYFGNRATYFFGGSLVRYRQVMAPYLLHFEIMRRAKALGHEWYDFWGVAPPNEPDHPWQNISAFKHKFGGVRVNLVPTLDYVYDPSAYTRYLAAKGEPKE
ncbi:MAG: peptidoglycan bridge formation glycyltransferase FemA/FemB family protein [Verrucomicrobiota bacterium]